MSILRIALSVLTVVGCGGGGTDPVTPPSSPPPTSVVAIRVSGATVEVGGSIQRIARAEDASGNPVNVTITWASDQPGTATVSPAGVVAGVSAGDATIRASAQGKTGTAVVAVRELRWSELPSQNFSSCGLTTGAELYCWGDAGSGVGGPASTTDHETCPNGFWCYSTPRRLVQPLALGRLAVGRNHVCGLTTDGAAWCWGNNDVGQLGAAASDTCTIAGASLPCSRTLVAVTGGKTFVSLVANRHTCGLTAAGEAWCWGQNDHGQLGSSLGALFSATPVRAGGALLFSRLATGYLHTCGIALDGVTYCWGNPPGLGSTRFDGPTATVVGGGHLFTAITAGDAYSCALTAAGAAYCWGTNLEGELGNGTFAGTETPVAVSGGHVFSQISAGHFYTCGLDTTGKAWCWGLNFFASLGIGGPAPTPCGDGTCASTPLAVTGGLTFRSIEAGNWVTCGITTTSRGYCWGRNAFGGVGNGRVDGIDLHTPHGVAGAP